MDFYKQPLSKFLDEIKTNCDSIIITSDIPHHQNLSNLMKRGLMLEIGIKEGEGNIKFSIEIISRTPCDEYWLLGKAEGVGGVIYFKEGAENKFFRLH